MMEILKPTDAYGNSLSTLLCNIGKTKEISKRLGSDDKEKDFFFDILFIEIRYCANLNGGIFTAS